MAPGSYRFPDSQMLAAVKVIAVLKKFLLFFFIALCASLLAASPPALRRTKDPAASGREDILPANFAGWQIAPGTKTSQDPAIADPANPTVMKEYGFRDFEAASYTRNERRITVRAARFADASGAYGAFTFYRDPRMQPEKIGDEGASANNRILFSRYNILLDVVLEKVTAMSATDLRELADDLPRPPGEAVTLPSLPNYLPRQPAVSNSAKYIVGPVVLEKVQAPLRFSLVDFSSGSEVALQDYSTSLGTATLMVIAYPTPQIAAAHLKVIEEWRSSAASQAAANGSSGSSAALPADAAPVANPAPVTLTGEFQVKRSGPLVAVVAGQMSAREAKSLLGQVHYEADVTWHEDAHLGPQDNVGLFLIALFSLIAIIIFITLVAGVAFGGIRILARRFFPDRVFDKPENVEFIRLNLKD